MDDTPSDLVERALSRRRAVGALSTGAVALLAGCRGLPFSEQPVRRGHLFVQNRADDAVEVALSVSEADGGDERLIHGVYRVPADTALEFAELLEDGTEYRVRARQPSLEEDGTNLNVVAETCADEDPAEVVAVAVTVSASGPEISAFNCDTPYTQTGEFEYVDSSEYRVGTPEGTVAGTPSS